MKFGAILLALLYGISMLAAQISDDMLELEYPALADSAWQDIYSHLEQLAKSAKLSSRLYLSDSSHYSVSTFLYEQQHAACLVNYRRDLDGGIAGANFRLRLRTANLEAVLGSVRFKFGRGLVVGNSSRAAADSLFSLYSPASPQLYTPLGVSAIYTRQHWRAALLASNQSREVRLSGGKISSVPSSHSDLLTLTRENVWSASLGYSGKGWQSAALLYYQSYNRPFADSSLNRHLWVGSLYSSLDMGPHTLDAELALLRKEPYGIIAWKYRAKAVSQTLSYARNTRQAVLPYAISPASLKTSAKSQEITYDLRYTLPIHTTLQFRYGTNFGAPLVEDRISRMQASLHYKTNTTSIKLVYYNYSLKILMDVPSYVDSVVSNKNDRSYRILLNARHQISKFVYQQLESSFNQRFRAYYKKNTYRYKLALGYKRDKLDLQAGFLSWQSPQGMMVEDVLDPEYFSFVSSDDNLVFTSVSQQLRNWNYSLSLQKSLLHPRDFRLNLRLGVSLL